VIRVPIILTLLMAIACGSAQKTAVLPDFDPRHGRILELEETIHVSTEQMSAGGTVCLDVCRLADDICRSQDDICRLAAETPEDAWAQARCEQAQSSCRDARARCLGCKQ